MALNGHLMALNGHCAGRHEGGTGMAVRMLAFCHGSIAFLGALTQYRGRSRLLGREERRSPMRARWTAPTTRDPPEIELGFEYERGNVARVAREGRVGLVCACGIRRVCDHRGQKLCPTRCALRAVWPSFYQRSNGLHTIRFRTPHHFIQASSSKAQDRPAALQSSARARPTLSDRTIDVSDPVFLLSGPHALVSRIKTTRTASHRMHCHLDMHLARLSPRTHARSAPHSAYTIYDTGYTPLV